jgi:chlorophyll/bacteriochlorophyll a synthase
MQRSLIPPTTLTPPAHAARPQPAVILELLKPVTWFPPMWAFGCGVVSSGQAAAGKWHMIVLGILLAGPLVCAMSQAVNDWFDRDVDAINEPNRPIPSGRMPGQWGLYVSWVWTGLSLLVAAFLGPFVFAATIIGLALALAYSAPPVRLKENGWWGNAACGLCYEGLAWVTGAAVMIGGAMPDWRILALAALYSFGTHGIMTLNDFKSIEGDRRMGVGSMPVKLGPERAGLVACLFMASAQMAVVALLFAWDRPIHGAAIAVALAAQLYFMRRLLTDPAKLAPWYNATGVMLFVLGMMVSAHAVRSLPGVIS